MLDRWIWEVTSGTFPQAYVLVTHNRCVSESLKEQSSDLKQKSLEFICLIRTEQFLSVIYHFIINKVI